MERNESRHGGYKAELVVSTLAIIKRVCLGICQVSRIVVPIDHKVNFKPKSRLIERRGLASRRRLTTDAQKLDQLSGATQ